MRFDKKWAWLLVVVAVVAVVFIFKPSFSAQAVALDVNSFSKLECSARLPSIYGGVCQECKVRCSDSDYQRKLNGVNSVVDGNGRTVDISVCQVGGGMGHLVEWYGDGSYCTGASPKIADGGCLKSVVEPVSQCQSGKYHLDSTCAAGGRCGEGVCVSTVFNRDCYTQGSDRICFNVCGQKKTVSSSGGGDIGTTPIDPVCTTGGSISNLGVPESVQSGAKYTVTGRFTANCAGDYYLEAYQDKNTYASLAAVSSSSGVCDDNIGTAGKVVSLQKGESVDVSFTLTDYGRAGKYSVVLGAYNGCASKLGGGWKVFDSDSKTIKVVSGSVDNSNNGQSGSGASSTGLNSIWLWIIGGGFIFVLIGVLLFVLLARRK